MIQVFEPWLKNAEARKQEGLKKPVSLVEACEILGDSKNLQDNAEAKLKVLEDAAASSQKMTSHNEADQKVCAFRERWTVVHECFKEWVARMVRSLSTFTSIDIPRHVRQPWSSAGTSWTATWASSAAGLPPRSLFS